jgi:5'-nucleotidase
MKILITNDDGINAEGLQILSKTIASSHDVFIIAPDRERSACSNIFTMRDDLVVTKHDKKSYSISGYPADCVSIGLHSDIIPKIDLVISGINHGPNLGDDIHFSGTVAGARTAFIFGKPSIAVSIDTFHSSSPFLIDTADFILNYINTETMSDSVYLNINYPNIPKDEIKGIKYTCLSRRSYIDSYVKTQKDDPSQFTMRLNGTIETKDTPLSDSLAVEDSYISITPMTIDSTDYKILNKYQK